MNDLIGFIVALTAVIVSLKPHMCRRLQLTAPRYRSGHAHPLSSRSAGNEPGYSAPSSMASSFWLWESASSCSLLRGSSQSSVSCSGRLKRNAHLTPCRYRGSEAGHDRRLRRPRFKHHKRGICTWSGPLRLTILRKTHTDGTGRTPRPRSLSRPRPRPWRCP